MMAASAQQLSDLIHRRQKLVDIQVAEKHQLSLVFKALKCLLCPRSPDLTDGDRG